MRRSTVALAGLALMTASSMGTATTAAANANFPRATIEVFPGPNAIKNALLIANSGDTLNIHAGTYSEHFTVSKSDLTLQSAGDGTVTVDGACAGTWTIQITGDDVTIFGLTVIGGSFYEIDFTGVNRGEVSESIVKDTCGDAEYGINVFNSASLLVSRNRASGFGDAGIYIGDLFGGMTTIRKNDSFGNNRGIIVENTSGVLVLVQENRTHDNVTTGIWVTNTDDIRVRSNLVTDNNFTGIETDQFANHNFMNSNVVSGHQYDLSNDGNTFNCWSGNVYTTSRGNVGC